MLNVLQLKRRRADKEAGKRKGQEWKSPRGTKEDNRRKVKIEPRVVAMAPAVVTLTRANFEQKRRKIKLLETRKGTILTSVKIDWNKFRDDAKSTLPFTG